MCICVSYKNDTISHSFPTHRGARAQNHFTCSVDLVVPVSFQHYFDISWLLLGAPQPASWVGYGTPTADVSQCNHSLRVVFGAGWQKKLPGFSQEVNREVMCNNSWGVDSYSSFDCLSPFLLYLSVDLWTCSFSYVRSLALSYICWFMSKLIYEVISLMYLWFIKWFSW